MSRTLRADAGVTDAIDAVDWGALPGHPDWYAPVLAARGMRALADAAHLVQAAEAGSLLGGGGIVHGHSGAVFPAAAVAVPLLLDIARHGRPAARDTALGLVDEALSSYPHAGYTRVTTPEGPVPICCAIAHQVRARAVSSPDWADRAGGSSPTRPSTGVSRSGSASPTARTRPPSATCPAASRTAWTWRSCTSAERPPCWTGSPSSTRPRGAPPRHACGRGDGSRANCRPAPSCCHRVR